MKFVSNKRGFSLLETMLGISIMTMAALGFSKYMQGQNKAQKSIEMNAELVEMHRIISDVLSSNEACEATFLGMRPGDNLKEIRQFKDLNKPAFLTVGEKFRNYNVYVKSIHMLSRAEQNQPSRNIVDGGLDARGVGYAYIEILYNRGAKEVANQAQTFLGGKDIKRIYPVKGTFANYTLLAGCKNDGTLSQQCATNAAAQGAPLGNYKWAFILDNPNIPTSYKVFEINGCPSPGGYMGECTIYKDTFPITSCPQTE